MLAQKLLQEIQNYSQSSKIFALTSLLAPSKNPTLIQEVWDLLDLNLKAETEVIGTFVDNSFTSDSILLELIAQRGFGVSALKRFVDRPNFEDLVKQQFQYFDSDQNLTKCLNSILRETPSSYNLIDQTIDALPKQYAYEIHWLANKFAQFLNTNSLLKATKLYHQDIDLKRYSIENLVNAPNSTEEIAIHFLTNTATDQQTLISKILIAAKDKPWYESLVNATCTDLNTLASVVTMDSTNPNLVKLFLDTLELTTLGGPSQTIDNFTNLILGVITLTLDEDLFNKAVQLLGKAKYPQARYLFSSVFDKRMTLETAQSLPRDFKADLIKYRPKDFAYSNLSSEVIQNFLESYNDWTKSTPKYHRQWIRTNYGSALNYTAQALISSPTKASASLISFLISEIGIFQYNHTMVGLLGLSGCPKALIKKKLQSKVPEIAQAAQKALGIMQAVTV